MLRVAIAGFCLCALSASAQEDNNADSMHTPVRVTAGVADQLLGQLSPDGQSLYYVSNAEASTQIFVLDIRGGRSHPLFDEGAEATWPRVSPDGRRLLYISYREQAQGQLCIRELPAAEKRRCLDADGALQAEWFDNHRIALVARTAAGDTQLFEVSDGASLSARPLLQRSVSSPAVSPDGQWLVFIPVDREVSVVGPDIAARAAAHLEIARSDDLKGGSEFRISLPGVTAQPAFSHDGRYLYFTQFLADSNQDGVVDAADHGVLFRIPFDPGSADVAAQLDKAVPEQLTDAAWNCQYPNAAGDKLYATCTQRDTLDVFELPLCGQIPGTWDNDRVRVEVELATQTSEQLLLYRRMITRAKTMAGHSLGMMRLVSLHLARAEFDAARYYASEAQATEDPAVRGLGRRLVAWVDQRQQAWERERGRRVAGFAKGSEDRFRSIAPEPHDSAPALILAHLVRSEIAAALGNFDLARTELEAAQLLPGTSRPLLELAFRQGDALYRLLEDREALLSWCRQLATLAKVAPDVQLRFARAYVRTLLRGLPGIEADAALSAEKVEPGSELAFAVELARTVRLIADDKTDPRALRARAAVLALYERESRFDRRHALVSDVIARASELGVDRITEDLAQKYIDDAKPGTAERRRAELLYRHAILGRAYRRRARNALPEARADFDLVVKHTHDLEALVGSLDLRLRAGEKPAAIAENLERSGQPRSVRVFGKSYLLAHGLRDVSGPAHAKALNEAVATLRSDWSELHGQRLARSLLGAIRQESFVATGDLADAERAATHYTIALKGLKSNLRLKATLLGQLGLLHTSVGNYRLALGYLDQRETFPYLENTAGLTVRLARARALLHVGKEAEAATVAEEAVSMVAKNPKLLEYRQLALDRAALYSLAAGRFEKALGDYDAELQLMGPGGSARNQLVVRLGRAAAALGAKQPLRTLEDVAVVEAGLRNPVAASTLQLKHSSLTQSVRAYGIISAGLEANALLQLGRGAETISALKRREKLLAEQFSESQRDVDERALVLVEDRLAAQDGEAAAEWAARALVHADGFGKLTGDAFTREQADALLAVAQQALGGNPKPDLRKRLEEGLSALQSREGSEWQSYRRWFELALAALPEAK